MANYAAGLEKAARLALTVSGDPWAVAGVVLADGTVARRFCTADDSALSRALWCLASHAPAGESDVPDLGGGRLPAGCLALANQAGLGSYRTARRRVAHGDGYGSVVLACAGAAPREADALRTRALALVLDLFAGADADTGADTGAGANDGSGRAAHSFQLLFESAPGLYLVLAPDNFEIVAASNAYLEATLVRRESIIGRPMFEVFPDDPTDEEGSGVAALGASLERVMQTRRPDVMAVQRYPIRRPREAGGGFEVRYWSPINSPVLDPSGNLLFIMHRVEDVTDYVLAHRPVGLEATSGKTARLEAEIVQRSLELRRMADSLAHSEQRLRMQAEMLDYATDAILVCDLDNRLLYWNRAAAARYGWSSEQVVGRAVGETLYAPCARSDFQHAMDVLMRHGDYSGRMMHSASDGRKFVVHVHWILVRHEDGTPRAILSVVTDLSEQIALEQRLLRIQKLDTLGRLTGGLAHDFNNWLTVIIGNAEELVEALDGQAELRDIAGMIQMAGQRGAELTRRLLAFGRRQPLTPQILQAGEVIEALRPLIEGGLPENIALRLLDTGHRWCVHVDRAQLESAVVNLCINARDAMPDGGTLTIQLMLAELGEERLEPNKSLAPGEYVVIAVADSGQGIAQEVLDQVFEPFFTTKEEAGGSGLGLSMVYGFATQSNGDATIYSEPGRGTQVKLYLPRAYSEPRPAPAPGPDVVHRPPRGCTVLLVEDDLIVRAHLRAQLGELGCEVTTASGAGEALSQLASGRHFDLLFSDVVMPGLSGQELARRARAMRPGLRILLSSGYTFEALPHGDGLGPELHFLSKPFGKAVLARALSEALAGLGEAP